MEKKCTYFDKETTVRGELTTDDLVLEGSFEGKIVSHRSVLLRKTVTLNADITTRKLKIEEGAQLNGKITLLNGKE